MFTHDHTHYTDGKKETKGGEQNERTVKREELG